MELAKSVNAKKSPSVRETIDLNGEWEFRMDPRDVGRAERWMDQPFDRKIQVPGAWNAQGMGYEDEDLLRIHEANNVNSRGAVPEMLGMARESEKLHHAFPGPAWYRRVVTIPADWRGKTCWLKFEGIHRYAEVWINGEPAATRLSYLTPLHIDLGKWAAPGEKAIITVRVDAHWNPAIDPMLGCLDTLDFLFITWGGIYGKVKLEAIAPTRIEDIFVIPQVAEKSAEIKLTFAGDLEQRRQVTAQILDGDQVISEIEQELAPGISEISVNVPIPQAKLWSPLQPQLYTARVTLTENGIVLDSHTVRFGLRELKVENGKFLLNGNPIFLRGYGDDSIFPKTIAPPADGEEYRKRLTIARDYGFNYIRHHSWFPPEEYFDIADELGMLVQPELPIAYAWNLATTPEQKQFMAVQWKAAIRRHRNHPSIITWGMGNELYKSFDFAPQLYQHAKEIDPTRLVIDSDGYGLNVDPDRDTLDYWVAQFAEGPSCGFQSDKYKFPGDQKKPVIAHEAGYFVTLPKLDQLKLFGQGLRPYWLTQARDLAEQNGMTRDYPRWVELSEKLQAICLKSNFEAARLSHLSGYSHWLFQDYPNCAEGVVDMFFRPKALSGEQFRKFNAPSVLLIETSRRNYFAGESAEVRLLISQYEHEPSSNAVLEWELRAGDKILLSGKNENLSVTSTGLQPLLAVFLEMPKVPRAEKLTLVVTCRDQGRTIANDWNFWVFPKLPDERPAAKLVIDSPGFENLFPSASRDESNLARCDLLLTNSLRASSLDYLAKGGRVILLAPEKIFSTEPTHYRLASWDGGGSSGTEIASDHPAFRDMPHDGWGDLQFFALIEGSKSILLDGLPSSIRPIMRFIDRPQRLQNRAYLFEVAVGKGKLLVSGFNFSAAIESHDPAAEYFLSRLLNYALGPDFTPTASLPLEFLRDKVEA